MGGGWIMKRIKKFLLLAVCFSLVGCVSNKQNGDEGLITKLVENDSKQERW